jgi:hypothetical protein
MIHRLHILDAFVFKPAAHFIRRDHRGAGPLRYIHNIRDVITMSVRNQNEISINLFNVDFFRERIGCDEWIEQKGFAADFDPETGVTVVSEFQWRAKREKSEAPQSLAEETAKG